MFFLLSSFLSLFIVLVTILLQSESLDIGSGRSSITILNFSNVFEAPDPVRLNMELGLL